MRTWTITLLASVVVLCLPLWARAEKPRVVVVLAGGISIRDLVDPSLPQLGKLIRSGSVGLMNVRTGRSSRDIEMVSSDGMEPGCVSLGAGAMAVAGLESRRAADAQEVFQGAPARDVYSCRTRIDAGSAAVIHTEIARMQRANASASYRATPGALGSALREAGLVTAVIGNFDLPGEARREFAAVAMDRNGLVDLGTVGSPALNAPDPSAPFGVRADTKVLLTELDRVFDAADARSSGGAGCFLVIGFADTFRADAYAELCLDHRAAIARRRAVGRLEDLMRAVADRLDPKRDLLVLVSPNSRRFSDIREERLAPVVLRGPGYRGGALTSPSTRTEGLVTISDFAPTILEFLGLPAPPGMVGRTMRAQARPDAPEYLLQLNLEAAAQGARQVAMRGGSVVQSIMVVAVTLMALVGRSRRARRAAAWTALIPVALPLSMLGLPLAYSGGLWESAALLAALTAGAIALCAWFLRCPVRSLAWLCAALVAATSLDLALGGRLIRSSIAGYSAVEGARYYGIGNELMGTMLGASLIAVGVALSSGRIPVRLRGAFAAVVYTAVFVFIGAGSLGANAGGALAAAPAFGTALLLRRGGRVSARALALAAAAVIAVAAGILAFDAMRSTTAQSHVGRAAGMAAEGGLWEVLSILKRKIALNLMLVTTSLWSRLLAFSAAGSAVLALWNNGRLKARLTREQRAAAIGCCAGALGAFAFNDSGVVAAATCSVILWALLAVVALGTETNES